MRTTLPVCGGGDGRASRSLCSRAYRMKKLLWLRGSQTVDVCVNTEPGVWLTSFQSLDTDAQCEDPVQEWGEEEEDGAVFGITLRRKPVLPASDAAELPAAFSFIQYHTVKVRRLKAANLERLVAHLLDPEHQEPDFVHVFLATYRTFTCTSTLIKLLFQRDDSASNPDNAVRIRSTVRLVIQLWLKEYSEGFDDPPQYQALRVLCTHLRNQLSFRRLVQTAETLLKRLQEEECSQSASENSNQSLQQEHGDREDKETKEEDKCSFMDFHVREVAEQLTRLDAELFVKVVPFHCLGCVWSQRDKKDSRNLAPTVRATISQFNAVTNRVITSLLCPLSPGPSTSSPLSSPSSSSTFVYPSSAPNSPHSAHTSPAHRARIIERWIAIAQECRALKNFSSLRAILSALQSNAVYRLKKTWAAVSRESMAIFHHLCETFPDENCVLTNREILVELMTTDEGRNVDRPVNQELCLLAQLLLHPDGPMQSAFLRMPLDGSHPDGTKSAWPCSMAKQMDLSSGVVPYLGTYLTVLTMLDTALSDTLNGGLINFEKRRREFEILSQIRQLQDSCSHYSLPVHRQITAWLQDHTLLTDQESYELSRDLEPPVDPCPSSPSSWSSRLLNRKKFPLSRTVSESSLRKTHADQISVSSSGSSSSDMEDLSIPQPSPLRLKLQSLSGSLRNVAEDFSTASSPAVRLSSSSNPDLSSSSLANDESSCSSLSPSVCSPRPLLPVYNKQVADSCIIRVSVESVSNGNVYKSILLTSQERTPQVIRRALEKHNMEDVSCHNFTLCQMLNCGKELQIPDKANVFYAMCTSSNYDFLLRQRWKSHMRHYGSSSSRGVQSKNRYPK